MKLFSSRLCDFAFKNCCVVLFIFLFTKTAISQRDIEPRLVFSDTSTFQFTGEWQYLSTDIYLFNGEKFSNLINELDFVKNQQKPGLFRKKGLNAEYLEYLFITANLKNVRFFGNNDLTYPLYNFQIGKDKDNKYRTFVSDNIDHIRIIDNLPLYSASDFIDAEIRVKAITNSDKDQVLGLVANQLKNISKIMNPTDAILGIIGEFGSFLESNSRKKEYHFSSTIRLFEQKNFDTRIHSIKVYALTTGNSQQVMLNTLPISAFLDSTENPEVNRQVLKRLVTYHEYPLIVVVNYKSLYKMEQMSGDEVSFANIEKRKYKIENDFRSGLINADTYRQEKDFVNFLTVFANLKNHIDVYNLNYKTGNSDAISGSLFRLLQYYRQLLKTYDEIKFKYRGNSTYQSVFSKEYESILGFAALYLDDDHNLKQLKELVKTLVNLETDANKNKSDLETTLSVLRFSDVIRNEQFSQSLEGQLIQQNISRIEKELYRATYEKEVITLDRTTVNSTSKDAAQKLRGMIQNTSCLLCKSKGFEAINNFGIRMEEYNRQVEVSKNDSMVKTIQPWIYVMLEKVQSASANLQQVYGANSSSEGAKYLTTKLKEAERDLKNIQDFMRIDVAAKDYATVQSVNQKLYQYKKSVDEALTLVCQLKPDLCNPDFKSQKVIADQVKTAGVAYLLSDSLIRQTNIFISIFDNQLSKAKGKKLPDDLQIIMNNAEQKQIQLKVTNDLITGIREDVYTYNKLEGEINKLIGEVSDLLVILSGYDD